MRNPIICAIDTPDVQEALHLARTLTGKVGLFKLGLEFFTSCGNAGVQEIIAATSTPVFLDLKFHDIPNTVAGAVSAATMLGVEMLTVHASGGRNMMQAAVKAAQEVSEKQKTKRPKILAVTVLTSSSRDDLNAAGVPGSVEEQVLRLAAMAAENGVDGIVCSAKELASLKKIYKDKLEFVVPGIRPKGADIGDQKRVMTPREAIDAGADYLVIGRPLTQAQDPVAAAENILKEIVGA